MLAAIERQPGSPSREEVLALVAQTLALRGPQGANRD